MNWWKRRSREFATASVARANNYGKTQSSAADSPRTTGDTGQFARLPMGNGGSNGQEGYRTRHYDADRLVPLPTHERPNGSVFDGAQQHPEYDPAYPAGYETASTGFIMVGAREYDPEIGRFLQPDPRPTGPELQWGQLNRWAYCANEPVNASDPSGEHPLLVFGGLVLLAALTMGFLNWNSGANFWAGAAAGAGSAALALAFPSAAGVIVASMSGSLANGLLSNNAADQILLDMAVSAAFSLIGGLAAGGRLGDFIAWLLGLDAGMLSSCFANFPRAGDGRLHRR